MRTLYLAVFTSLAALASASAFSAEVRVNWAETVNANAQGNTLTRTGGCDGCPVSGAISAQEIRDGNGHLTFNARGTDGLRYVGLTHGEEVQSTADFDFAFRLQEGSAEVRENDAFRADTPYTANDTFKIVVQDSRVRYYKNNSLIHSSRATAESPLVAVAGLIAEGTQLSDVRIGSPTMQNDGANNVANNNRGNNNQPANNSLWSQTANVDASSNRVEKTGGCDGCLDAGAISQKTINRAPGFVEFVVNDPNKMLSAGLQNGETDISVDGIDYALRFQNGVAEVRENANYKADTRFQAGDKFRIAVSESGIRYFKNGTVFYESSTRPQFPLKFMAALLDSGAVITEVAMR